MLSIDLHTHSIASGHALNTVYELAYFAHKKGIKYLGVTDHGPSMEGAPHDGYFWISDQIDELCGVKLFLGIEANIINTNGQIDLEGELLSKQRIVSAGLHARTPYIYNSLSNNTKSIINATENPYIKIITHPYRPDFQTNLVEIFQAAYNNNVLLELNNSLFGHQNYKDELIANYSKLVSLCIKYDYPVIIGSDAHTAPMIGNDDNIRRLQQALRLPEELIINNKINFLLDWLDIKDYI